MVIVDAIITYLMLAGFLIGGMLLFSTAVILIQGDSGPSSYQVAEEARIKAKREANERVGIK